MAGDRVYFGVRGGRPTRLVALSAQNGKLPWEMDLEGAVPSAPVVAAKLHVMERFPEGQPRESGRSN